MNAVPRLSVGLPIYNSQTYLAETFEALLGQNFTDFELIVSDNASTDSTADICRQYAKQDSRIRYFLQPRNIGLAPNHNYTLDMARGELFKWAAGDDLYARDLLGACVDALDKYPEVVLAHSYTAMIDGTGKVFRAEEYPLSTSSPRAPERFRSTLFDDGGDDDGGIMRTAVLRRIARKNSYHHADRTIISELTLQGPFYQVPEWLYFRRDHPGRAERAHASLRSRCANMDPRRADKRRHPAVRLYGEYVWAYLRMIRQAPISAADKRECYRSMWEWASSRARSRHPGQAQEAGDVRASINVDELVAGRKGSMS